MTDSVDGGRSPAHEAQSANTVSVVHHRLSDTAGTLKANPSSRVSVNRKPLPLQHVPNTELHDGSRHATDQSVYHQKGKRIPIPQKSYVSWNTRTSHLPPTSPAPLPSSSPASTPNSAHALQPQLLHSWRRRGRRGTDVRRRRAESGHTTATCRRRTRNAAATARAANRVLDRGRRRQPTPLRDAARLTDGARGTPRGSSSTRRRPTPERFSVAIFSSF